MSIKRTTQTPMHHTVAAALRSHAVCALNHRAPSAPQTRATTTPPAPPRLLRKITASPTRNSFFLAAAILSFDTTAHAAIYTFTGGSSGTSTTWDSTSNWNPTGAYPNSPSDTARFDFNPDSPTYFPLTANKSITVGTRILNAVVVSGPNATSTPTFTLAGTSHTLTLAGDSPNITLTGGGTLAFTAQVSSDADLLIDNNSFYAGAITFGSSSPLTVGGQLTFNTTDSASTITVSGTLSAGSLLKTGSGTLTVSRTTTTPTTTIAGDISFANGTIAVSGTDALGTGTIVLSGTVGGSRKLILASAKNATLSNSLNISASDITIGRADTPKAGAATYTLTLAPDSLHAYTSNIGTGERTINVGDFTTFDIGENQSFSGAGTLVKAGDGNLVLRGANSTFSALNVTAGKLTAHLTTASSTLGAASNSASVLGAGTVTVSGANTLLEIVSDADANTLALGPFANIKLLGAATLSFNNGLLDLAAGKIDLNDNGNLILNVAVRVGDTAIKNAPAGLNFPKDITFTTGTAITANHSFNLTNPADQTLSGDGINPVTLAKVLNKTGAGTTILAPSITQLNLPAGMNLSAGTFNIGSAVINSAVGINITNGTLSFENSTAANQLGTTPISFTGNATATGGIALHGNNKNFPSVTLSNNAAANFDLGGDATTSTTLHLGAVTLGENSVLRIQNYTTGTLTTSPDIVSAATINGDSAATDNHPEVWFYGYNKGASFSNGVLTPNDGFLQSTFTNRTINTKQWTNPANWASADGVLNPASGDPYNIPNAPGASANFDANGKSLTNDIIYLNNATITIGRLYTNWATLNFRQGTLIFDSGVPDDPAEWIMESAANNGVADTYNSTHSTLSMLLNSNLRVTSATGYSSFTGIITGKRGIIIDTKTRLQLGNTANEFTGGIFLDNGGTIAVSNGTNDLSYPEGGNWFGRGAITIGEGGGTIRGDHYGSSSSARMRQISNQIILNGDLSAGNMYFNYDGDVAITGSKKITSTSTTLTPGYVGTSVIFGPNFNFTGDGELTLDTGVAARGIGINSMKNTFSGGLIKTGAGSLIVNAPTGISHVTLGRRDDEHNPLGTYDIKIDNGTIQLTANAPVYWEDSLLTLYRSASTLAIVDGNANGTLYLNSGEIKGSGTIRFDHGLEIHKNITIANSINLQTFARSDAGISLQGDRTELAVASFTRDGNANTTTTLETSVNKLKVSGKINLNAGTFMLTRNDQLERRTGTPGIVLNGGTLNLNGTKQGENDSTRIPNLSLVNSSTIFTGNGGGITFTSADDVTWSGTALLLIQNSNGAPWTADGSNSYIRFSSDVNSILTKTRLDNITFSGYEEGAQLVLGTGTDNNFYYLLPFTDTLANEWNGLGTDANFSIWAATQNWSISIPQATNSTAIFRNADPALDGKKIIVEGNRSLGKLILDSNATAYSFGGDGTLVFSGNNLLSGNVSGALLTHTKSTVEIATAWQLDTPLEIRTTPNPATGGLILSNQISGNGDLLIKGNGNNDRLIATRLTLQGNNGNWRGNLIWEDNIALAIPSTENNLLYRLTGSGHFYIGGTDSTKSNLNKGNTYSFSMDAPSLSAPTIRLDGGYSLNANLAIGNSQNSTDSSSLTLIGDGKLGEGIHTIDTDWTLSGGVTRTVLKLDGVISDADDVSGGINKTGSGELHLTSKNTFTGDFIWTQGRVRMDTDDALGLGVLYMNAPSSSSNLLISNNSNGVRLHNKIIFGSTETDPNADVTSYFEGDIIFEGSPSLGPSRIETGAQIRLYNAAGTVIFGKDFVLEGATETSRISFLKNGRILSSGNTYKGGTKASSVLEIGASSVVDSATGIIESGPVGTGTLTLSDTASLRVYSTDKAVKIHTLANTLAISNRLAFAKSTEPDNEADTLILSASTLTLPDTAGETVEFNIGSGAILHVESQIKDAPNPLPILKTSSGTLVLANPANVISKGIENRAGIVRTEVTGAAAAISIDDTPASADAPFGAGSRLTQTATLGSNTAGTFEIAVATENAEVTLTPAGAARYALNENGTLKISGTNITTILGDRGSLQSTSAAGREGVLEAQNIQAANFDLGVKVKATTLTIGDKENGAGVVLGKANLLLTVGEIIFTNGATLDLNKTAQTVNKITVSGDNSVAAINVDSTGFSAIAPLLFTIKGDISVTGNNSLLWFENWAGDPTNGLGNTRIVTTALNPGTILDNVRIGSTSATHAIAKLNSAGQVVLLSFNNIYTWVKKTAGGDFTWGNASNWRDPDGSTGVPNTAGAMVEFDSVKGDMLGKTVTTNNDYTFGSLLFAGEDTETFTLTGASLILDSGVENENSQTSITQQSKLNVTINNNIRAYSTGDKTRSGIMEIKVKDSGDLILNGQVSGINSRMVVDNSGTGRLILKGENTFTGGFTLKNGTVLVGNDSAFGSGALVLEGGTLGATSEDARNIGNTYTIAGDITFIGDKDLHLSGINGHLRGSHTLTSNTTGGAIIYLGTNNTPLTAEANAQLTLEGSGNFNISAKLVDEITLVINHYAKPESKPTPSTNTTTLSGDGNNFFNADLEIKKGRVELTGAMGASTGAGNNYTKDFILGGEGIFQYAGGDTQILSGKIKADSDSTYGTISNAKTGTLEIAGYEFINHNPIKGSHTQKENPFQGNLEVLDGTLRITGPLGSETETFDGGTSLAATYYHARYKGGMYIGAGGVLEFAYKNDYQYASGALTGSGHLRINSGMPFYYAGDASGFSGATTVTGGSSFHLNTATSYGGDGAPMKSFEVKSGSALYIGADGAKIYTKNFEMDENTMLVVNAKNVLINSPVIKLDAATEKNVTFVFRVSTEEFGNENVPSKLTFVSTGGVVLDTGNNLRLDVFGYIPQPSQNYAILMSGLNIETIWNNYMGTISDPLPDDFSEDVHGVNIAQWIFNDAEKTIMENFRVRFTINGELRIDLANAKSNFPEPGTYGLFSGVFLAGLAFLHRRRKRNPVANKRD